MNVAEALLNFAMIWGWIGAAVALVFLTVGIDRIDEDADGAYVFRPLLVPGVILIWPLVLWRWYVLATGRDQWALRHKPPRHRHAWFAYAMPVAIVVILALGLGARQHWPADIAPERLSAAGEVRG